jgi:cell division protein FtsW
MKRTLLLVVVLCAYAIGLLMVFNTSAAEVVHRSLDKSTHFAFFKQFCFGLIGALGGLGVWLLGYQSLVKISFKLLTFFTFLLILVLIPGIGQEINGAKRWLSICGYSFQPSEFAKYLIPLCYVRFIALHTNSTAFSSKHVEKSAPERLKGETQGVTFRPFLKSIVILSLPVALIFIEPDNGTAALILVALTALFILTRIKWTYWLLPLVCLMLTGMLVASQMRHVPDRIRVYLKPELDLRGKGHQPHQAKIAAGSGQLFGKGPAESMQKLDFLPEARNDYIAAIFAEEYGFIGILSLIFLYMAIAYLGFSIAADAADLQGFYVAAIFTFLISLQAFLNLGVVSGLLPSKGTNLPFFSQGGSSLLANFMAISLILNIAQAPKEIACQKQLKF